MSESANLERQLAAKLETQAMLQQQYQAAIAVDDHTLALNIWESFQNALIEIEELENEIAWIQENV